MAATGTSREPNSLRQRDTQSGNVGGIQAESTTTSSHASIPKSPRPSGLKLYLHKDRLYNTPQTADARRANCRDMIYILQGLREIDGQTKATKNSMTKQKKKRKKSKINTQ